MNQTRSERKYLPTLDGWRAIAVFAVMISHGTGTFIALGLTDERFLLAASWGRLGVDLFFAISGFLISYQLLIELKMCERISLKAFYIRRSFRILPLYYAYLILLGVLSVTAGLPVSRQEFLSSVLFFRNYAIPSEGGYTNHFWSLAVEEHFYILWPFTLILLKPSRAIWTVPPLALAVHCWRSADSRWYLFAQVFNDTGIVWRTDTRMDALLWGCFAALIYVRFPETKLPRWMPWVALGLLPVLIIFHAPALPLLTALLFPLLIISTVLYPTCFIGRALELRPLRWVGRLSYSLYVWQTLFLQRSVSPDPIWLARLKSWPINLCMIVSCSVLTHYLLEKPMIRLGRIVGRRFTSKMPKMTPQQTGVGDCAFSAGEA